MTRTSVTVTFNENAAQPRIDRQMRQGAADRRQPVVSGQCPDFHQKLQAVPNGTLRGRVDEREALHVTQPQ